MPETPLQRLHRQKLNLRIGPEMAEFVRRRIESGQDEFIAIIGADARTGVPQRRQIKASELRDMLKEARNNP